MLKNRAGRNLISRFLLLCFSFHQMICFLFIRCSVFFSLRGLSVFKKNYYSCSIIQNSITQNARSAQFKIQKSKFKILPGSPI